MHSFNNKSASTKYSRDQWISTYSRRKQFVVGLPSITPQIQLSVSGEFERIRAENEVLMTQIKTLKASKRLEAAVPVPNASITPPDSSSDKSAKGAPLI
jgi:hypothetical protein